MVDKPETAVAAAPAVGFKYPRWKHKVTVTKDAEGESKEKLDSKIVNSIKEEDKLGGAYFDTVEEARKHTPVTKAPEKGKEE